MDEMDMAGWRSLQEVAEKNVLLDSRSVLDKVRLPAFLKLYERGYCTLVETGPGDSVHIFAISEGGKEALDARRRSAGQ